MVTLFGGLAVLAAIAFAVGTWEWAKRRQQRLATTLRTLRGGLEAASGQGDAEGREATSKFPAALRWIERRAQAAGVDITPQTALVVLASGVAAVFIAALAVTGEAYIAVLASLGGLYAPVLYLEHQARRRVEQAFRQLDQACQLIGQAMRAGENLQKALASTAPELGPPLGPELNRIVRMTTYGGAPLRDAVLELKHRIPMPETQLLVSAMRLHLETGANLPAIIDRVRARLRDRRETRAVLRSATAQARVQGYILAAMPLFITMAIRALHPTYFDPLFETAAGQIVFVFAMLLVATGAVSMRRMTDIG
ncbi:MAG TPA: type II secretion system F family protein [Thermaerobacter sp.]